MCDLSNKGSEMSCKNSPESDGSISSDGGSSLIKTCADCGTTKTPLWRGGPDGPKSLCNACGIRSRKKRRAVMEIRKDDKKQMKRIMAAASSTSNDDSQSSGLTTSKSSNMGDFCLKMVLQKPRSKVRKQTRKLGEEEEEEEAAFLLMALSCGSTAVF